MRNPFYSAFLMVQRRAKRYIAKPQGEIMRLIILICFVIGPVAVFAMGQQPSPQSDRELSDFVKSCSKATQKAFKKKYPKYVVEKVTYSVDPKDQKITKVTVHGADPKACTDLPPAVVGCYDFGNSIVGKCVSGKLVEVVD